MAAEGAGCLYPPNYPRTLVRTVCSPLDATMASAPPATVVSVPRAALASALGCPHPPGGLAGGRRMTLVEVVAVARLLFAPLAAADPFVEVCAPSLPRPRPVRRPPRPL